MFDLADFVTDVLADRYRTDPEYHTVRRLGTSSWLLTLTRSGGGVFRVKGEMVAARPGDLIALRPDSYQDYRTDPSKAHWEFWWAHFIARPNWMEWLTWPEVAPGVLRLELHGREDRGRVARAFAGVIDCLTRGPEPRSAFAMNAMERMLLHCFAIEPKGKILARDPATAAAMEHLRQHFDRPISLDGLAASTCQSVSRLRQVFKRETGITPRAFHEHQRMQRAAQLLRLTSMSVKEIARHIGFDDPFYFTTRFRKFSGFTPRQFRSHRLKPSSVFGNYNPEPSDSIVGRPA